ncbi:SMI1/KNR4 family protein [Kordia sp.]|uniref:SMI1/KNR4 family protein n=1 Tax=Kordia sp. TaxID=1965332 RepID=UPI003B5CDCDE
MDYTKQIKRIKEKLAKAKKIDTSYNVFGARSHQYIIDTPATEKEVIQFEEKYNIKLPSCYRAFLTQIGNGGNHYKNSITGNSAAGPDYGIYKLGSVFINCVANTELGYLQKDVFFTENTTFDMWDRAYEAISDDVTDDEFDEIEASMYAGILTIGHAGCSNFNGIVLNGTQRGRVINIYDELEYPPHYKEEKNFLDWYESWLNKIISK